MFGDDGEGAACFRGVDDAGSFAVGFVLAVAHCFPPALMVWQA
jgi:hypothetical protein